MFPSEVDLWRLALEAPNVLIHLTAAEEAL